MPDIAKFAGRGALALLAGLVVSASCATSDSVADSSYLVPIKIRDNPNEGKLVYSISVVFGSRILEAVLDTGSMPALVLKGRVPPSVEQQTGATFSVTYGSDRTYGGNIVQAPVSIGPAFGTIAFGVVTSAQCMPVYSNCPIAGEGPRDALFASRYPSIVGARITTAGNGLQSAFRELGVHRFIITAPRQYEGGGTLEFDPTANETSGYTPIYNAATSIGVPGGSVRGCLRDKRNSASYCGAVFFDTGRTGVLVTPPRGNTQSTTWRAKDAAQLEFTDANGAEIAGVDFTVGADDQTQVAFGPTGLSTTDAVIQIGQLPYVGLSILSDLDNKAYAVLPRPPAADGVVGHVP